MTYIERPTEAVYVTDMDNRGMSFSQYPFMELMEVPEEYVPGKENFFDEGIVFGRKGSGLFYFLIESSMRFSSSTICWDVSIYGI